MNSNNFNKLQVLFGLFLAFIGLLPQMVDAAESHEELVLLNWADYIAPDLLKTFSERYKISVKEVFFESDQARTEMLLRSQGRGYDLALTGASDIAAYRKRGWVAPLTEVQVPNLKHADSRWLKAFNAIPEGYAAPYLWGSLGILYRTDKVSYPITSWKQLFVPDPALKGRIRMLRDPRDLLGLGLKSLGYSYNSSNADELKQLEKLLLAQQPFVSGYGMPQLNETSGFVTGEHWIGMVFNGDALILKELTPHLHFVIPQEGTGLWCDYLIVMQASAHKTAAYQLIDFLNQPENAVRLAQYLQYASTNQAAEKLLPADYLKNPLIYPSKQVLDLSETAAIDLPPRGKKQRAAIYNKIIQN